MHAHAIVVGIWLAIVPPAPMIGAGLPGQVQNGWPPLVVPWPIEPGQYPLPMQPGLQRDWNNPAHGIGHGTPLP